MLSAESATRGDCARRLQWLLQSSVGAKIDQRISSSPSDSLHAPHLLDVEVTQVLRRYVRDTRRSPHTTSVISLSTATRTIF